MPYNFNKPLSKEFYTKCITRNINKINILDNYTNFNINIENKVSLEFSDKKTQNIILANQNNKNLVLKMLIAENNKNYFYNQFLKKKFEKNKKLRYAFLIKPYNNGFIYYSSQNFGFFSKNFLKAFIIMLKKVMTKEKGLANKVFLCNLSKNQQFIFSKLKVLSNKISFLMKFDKKIRKNLILLNQKFVLPIKIKYAKNKKTNKNSIKSIRKNETFSSKIFYRTKNKVAQIYRKDNIKFTSNK